MLRNATATHQNAHFNMIDRALEGPRATRDADTARFLDQWLQYIHRVDTGAVTQWNDAWRVPTPPYTVDPSQPNKTVEIVSIPDRPTTDFLWQRSPQLLYSTGDGTMEYPGVDYLLPYWMARYYGVVSS